MVRSRHKPLKVSFFGHFGSANAGNESTLLAILTRLRSLSPEGEYRCICTNPEAVAARYGIAAIPITSRAARIWPREIPLAKRVPLALVGLGKELGQYARAFKMLKGCDTLIVPGTGLVTDAWGLSSWGPYNLFKWVLMAKLRRCRVLFLSVGAGPIDRRIGRALVKATLSLADYRSYRDDASRDYLRGLGFPAERDPVYPDLVFGLPEPLLSRTQVGSGSRRRVVGLGLMVYPGKYSAADPRPETYTGYLESLGEFAAWLLEHDYDIRLLLGDADARVIEELRSVLEARLGSYDEKRILEQPISSVEHVIAELDATDVVVATRFHNVLLALLLDKPTIAISFHHKCASLMRQMKLSEYCHEIEGMDADRLIGQFRKLEENHDAVKRTICHGVDRARAAVDEQYKLYFESPQRTLISDLPRSQDLRRKLETVFLSLNERIWGRLSAGVRDLRPVRTYAAWLHALVSQRADREMYVGTHFLRNRPALELMRRLVQKKDDGTRLRIGVLGCSIGVEVYSILWTLRSSRPDLELAVHAVDISPEVVAVGERGIYGTQASEMVNHSIFDGLTEAERGELFDWQGDEGAVKPWLRHGITWRVGDASDPDLVTSLGPQDIVIANNFLCHMDPQNARRCLRNLARLVSPGGYLFVSGVDLDVRTQVAIDLGWEPVPELRAEIHDGDQFVRSDWPWRWWGVEPLDRRRPGWETRYSAVFRVGTEPQLAGAQT
jgi:polysaccharide pyruvyl transferase WcaK-like protein/chemotaxis methyl-accepting protein methylase